MGGNHRVGKCLLTLGTLIVGLATIAPAYAAPQGPTTARAPAAAGVATAPPTEGSKVILGDTSVDGPALWTANPSGSKPTLLSVLAWTGTDPGHSLNIMQSSDGLHYGQKVIFNESSATRPAVAVQTTPAVTIVLAWTGTDANHSLNLLCQGAACGSGAGREKKLIISANNSFTSPALVHFGNTFLLSWAGTDPNHSLNILPFTLTTSGSGFSLGQKTILGQFHSSSRPSLAVNPQNNQLLLSWSATSPANQLTFATSGNGTSWSGAQAVGDESSASGPNGFAVAASGMPPVWMTWTGLDAAHSVNVRFTTSFPQWPLANNKTILNETALGGPALGYVGTVGQMLLGWTGTDAAHHLNLAIINTSATTPTPTPTATGVAVKVFFSKHPDSDSDPNKVFAVQRTSPTSGVATYAVNQLIAGPTASEKSTGLFTELTGALSGTSNCGGADFTITLDKKGNTPEPGTATLRFCRTTSIPGELAGGRMLAELNATLTQFPTIKKAVILNKDGNCFADLSGKNLCLS